MARSGSLHVVRQGRTLGSVQRTYVRRTARCLLAAIVLVCGALAAGAATAQTQGSSTVLGLRLTGVVDPFVADYLERGIADAASAGDAAVLITIDTPGGLDSSMRQITQAVLNADIPVIGYVAPSGARAASAGAFVLMSTPVAAMAPGTNVGRRHPRRPERSDGLGEGRERRDRLHPQPRGGERT